MVTDRYELQLHSASVPVEKKENKGRSDNIFSQVDLNALYMVGLNMKDIADVLSLDEKEIPLCSLAA